MHRLPRLCSAAAVGIAGAAFVAASEDAAAQAATFPVKPVRIIVPFAPGGPNDLIVRLVGPRLGEAWAQPVLVENRPGAGATTGMEVVARSTPDGYTLGVGNNSSLVIGPLMQPKVGYDPVKDLVPMGSMAMTAYVVAVNPRIPRLCLLGRGHHRTSGHRDAAQRHRHPDAACSVQGCRTIADCADQR
jgi:tripartite-type tricarboxylate transporter receptor subunit TctC